MSDEVEKLNKLKSLTDKFDREKKIKNAYKDKRDKLNRPLGYCSMVFHAWKDNGEVSYEVLESGAGSNGFMFMSRDAYEIMKEDKGWATTRPVSDFLHEVWEEGDTKNIIMEEIVGEVDLQEGEDRYFEFVADYSVDSSVNYWGEYDCWDEVTNEDWHEIAKEEYDNFNQNTLHRLEDLLGNSETEEGDLL